MQNVHFAQTESVKCGKGSNNAQTMCIRFSFGVDDGRRVFCKCSNRRLGFRLWITSLWVLRLRGSLVLGFSVGDHDQGRWYAGAYIDI